VTQSAICHNRTQRDDRVLGNGEHSGALAILSSRPAGADPLRMNPLTMPAASTNLAALFAQVAG
jgi:hypothetical protein